MTAANPESIYFSEIVTPPFPPRSKQAPIIKDVRQFAQLDLTVPCDQAIAYMIKPARRNRVPANCLAEISRNERAGNTEKNRHDAAAGIPSRHQQVRNRADNKTDNQNPEDRVRTEVHMRTRFIELIASRQGIGLKFCGWHSRSLRGIS